jgi:hypothetical protein
MPQLGPTSKAIDGDILIGSETAARINGKIELFDRGHMKFKNVKDDVQVYCLIRATK